MANENNKPYFLLVFEKGDNLPTIISADVISKIYPNERRQKLIIKIKNNGDIILENVTHFKMAPAEELDFNM